MPPAIHDANAKPTYDACNPVRNAIPDVIHQHTPVLPRIVNFQIPTAKIRTATIHHSRIQNTKSRTNPLDSLLFGLHIVKP